MKFEFEAVADESLDPRTEIVFRLNGADIHRIQMPGDWISDSEDERIEHGVKNWFTGLCELMERQQYLMKLTDGMVERTGWSRW